MNIKAKKILMLVRSFFNGQARMLNVLSILLECKPAALKSVKGE